MTARLPRVGAGLVVLGGLYLLRRWGLLATGAYQTDTGVTGGAFLAQLAALALSLGSAAFAPIRWRWLLLGSCGLGCLLLHRPAMAVAAVLLVALTTAVLSLTRRVWLRGLIFLATAAALALAERSGLIDWGHAFSMAFFYRTLVLVFDDSEPVGALALGRRVSVFYLVAPLAVFHPYLCFIPWREELDLDRPAEPPPWRRGLTHFGWAVVYAGLLWLLSRTGQHAPALLRNFLAVVFQVAQLVHVIQALLLLHGFDCRAAIRWPLASTSYLDYWSRFLVHQKDVQVMLFYLPLMMRLRRLNRYLAIAVALAITLVAWNTLLHLFSRYLFRGDVAARTAWALQLNLINWVVLAASLIVVEWRKQKRAGPLAPLWRPLGWASAIALAMVTT